MKYFKKLFSVIVIPADARTPKTQTLWVYLCDLGLAISGSGAVIIKFLGNILSIARGRSLSEITQIL